MLQEASQKTNHKRHVVKLLNDHGITPTHQRVEIGLVLLTKAQHMSADLVLEKANSEQSIVSKATVYNTLGLFARKGLIREVIVDASKVFYDSNTRPHHHFYDVTSGTLHDITEELEIRGLPSPPESACIQGVDVIVRITQDCADRN